MTLRTLLDRFDLLMDTPESVPKLRRFILRLGLQGRLTEQRTEDTDVDVLIESLQAEKQRLYDEGEIRKPRSLDPLDEGENWHRVPSEWAWTKVGEVGRIIGGSTPRTSNDEYWADQGIAWLTPGDLGDHEEKMVSRGDRDISKEGLESCSATLLPPGSVLFSSRAPIGYVAIAADELSTNQGFKSVRPYEMGMSHYIYWFLKYAGKRINDEASGTTFTEVSGTDLANIPFPLPPLEEQQRIVETVDRLMGECDALEKRQERERTLQVQVGTAATEALQSADDAEALRPAWERVREHFDTVTTTPEGVDALRQTILQLAVQGRLTERDPDDAPADELLEQIQQEKQRLYDAGEIRKPKKSSNIEGEDLPFELPDSWEWVRLTDAVQRVVDCLHETAPFEDEDTGYYCVDTTCMNETEIEFENLRPVSEETYEKWTRRMDPQGGDILFSREGNIGLTAIVPEEINICLGQRMMIFRLPDKLLPRYFHLVLQSPVIIKQWKPEVMGTAATRVNISTIRDFLVPFPPVEEQARITGSVDEILSTCDDLKTKTVEAMEKGENALQAVLQSLSTSMDRKPVEA